jgi:hypothetical protein
LTEPISDKMVVVIKEEEYQEVLRKAGELNLNVKG